jgi:hypothetical protein
VGPRQPHDSWILLAADRELRANKYGPTLLGFVLIHKFFEVEAPRHDDA